MYTNCRAIGAVCVPIGRPAGTDQMFCLEENYLVVADAEPRHSMRQARIAEAFRYRVRGDSKYARYGRLPVLATVSALSSAKRPQCDRLFLEAKGREFCAIVLTDLCVVSQRLLDAIDDEQLLQLLVYARTCQVGQQDINDLKLSGRELVEILEKLCELNQAEPGKGITAIQKSAMLREIQAKTGTCTDVAAIRGDLLAAVDLETLISNLDIAPKYSVPCSGTCRRSEKTTWETTGRPYRNQYIEDMHTLPNPATDRRIEAITMVYVDTSEVDNRKSKS